MVITPENINSEFLRHINFLEKVHNRTEEWSSKIVGDDPKTIEFRKIYRHCKRLFRLFENCLTTTERYQQLLKVRSDSGWVDRTGKFHPCAFTEHIDLALRLGTSERACELNGWVKLSGGSYILPGDKKPTKRQIDTIFDWCELHDNITHPYNGFNVFIKDID